MSLLSTDKDMHVEQFDVRSCFSSPNAFVAAAYFIQKREQWQFYSDFFAQQVFSQKRARDLKGGFHVYASILHEKI